MPQVEIPKELLEQLKNYAGKKGPKTRLKIPPPRTPRGRVQPPKGGGTAIGKNPLGGTENHPYWGRKYETFLKRAGEGNKSTTPTKEMINRRLKKRALDA